MFYEEINPSFFLREFVKCYWILEQSGEEAKNSREKILPDGCPEIVFNLASPFRRHYFDRIESQPNAIVVGQIKYHVTVEPTSVVKLFGVRFRPNGLYPLLRQSTNDLTGRIESIDAVLGKLGNQLAERLNEAVSTVERIKIFEQSVFCRFEGVKNGRLSSRATEIIVKNDGQIRVEELAKSLDTNWKTLERHFTREVGITPKLFCRITRLQKILAALNREKQPNWADIAYRFGYVDQSHFIKDFREFAGVSPATFISSQNLISNSFVG